MSLQIFCLVQNHELVSHVISFHWRNTKWPKPFWSWIETLQDFSLLSISVFSRVFLQRQIWIINYYVKSWSKNLSKENINTGVSVVFKTIPELKCQNNHFSGNTSFFVFIAENFWRDFGRNNWWSIFDIVERLIISYLFL